MNLNSIPDNHRQANKHIEGKTNHGLNFNIEIQTDKLPLSTNARAKMISGLREKIMNHKGISAYEAFQRSASVNVEGVEEKTSILLRIATDKKIHRFHVEVSPDGFYSSGTEKSRNFRSLIKDIAFNVEESYGLIGSSLKM